VPSINFSGAGPLRRRASASVVTGSREGELDLGCKQRGGGGLCGQCVRLRAECGDVKERLREEAGRCEFYREEMERSRGERDEARGEVSEANKVKDECVKRMRDKEEKVRRLEREVVEAERRGKEELAREREKGESDRDELRRALESLAASAGSLEELRGKVEVMGRQLDGLTGEKVKVERERDEAVTELLRMVNERKESMDKEDGREVKEKKMALQIALMKKEWEKMKDSNLKLLTSLKGAQKETSDKGTFTSPVRVSSSFACVGTSPVSYLSTGVCTSPPSPGPPPLAPVKSNETSTQTTNHDNERARRAVASLREAVEGELACVRKHGHLVNLSNTGNLRAMQVRVSGLELRLEAANRIRDVLEFHAVSAERKLGEYEGDTAAKIKKGREGRGRMEKEKLARDLEGLDQRSREAGGIMGSMMMGKVPQARALVEEAKEVRERVVREIVEGAGEIWGGDRVEVNANGMLRNVYV
ncbi:hypothetical protein TrRE_jg532, partial [Triparma retinervis]